MLSGFAIMAVLILVVVLIIYSPVFYRLIISIRLKKQFVDSLHSTKIAMQECLIVRVERLGEGASQNSDITFERAQCNQNASVYSVLRLFHAMMEK